MKQAMTQDASNEDTTQGEIPQHEVESAASDLMRAEKHKSNPKLMAKVHKHLNGQKSAITSIQGLKEVANSKLKDMSAEDTGEGEGLPKSHK